MRVLNIFFCKSYPHVSISAFTSCYENKYFLEEHLTVKQISIEMDLWANMKITIDYNLYQKKKKETWHLPSQKMDLVGLFVFGLKIIKKILFYLL